MGLHGVIQKPFWVNLEHIRECIRKLDLETEGNISISDNFMIFHATEYSDEQTFCGTYMRNYFSAEYWTYQRWEPPLEIAGEYLRTFEWYGGGCSNRDICYYGSSHHDDVNTTDLHAEQPNPYMLLSYMAGSMWQEYMLEENTGIAGCSQFPSLFTPESFWTTDQDTAITWNIQGRNPITPLQYWKDENPRCPIRPMWSSEQAERPRT